MDKQLKYIKESPISQKQCLRVPKYKFICCFILWMLLLIYLIQEWNNQLPKIIISRIYQADLLSQNKGIQLKFLSQTLQSFDNVLVVVHNTNESDQQLIQSNKEGSYNIPFGQFEIQICNESNHNITCANQNQIAAILGDSIEIEILLQITQYNYEEQTFFQVPKSLKYYIHKNTQQLGHIQYQIVQTEIRSNDLFTQSQTYTQIEDAVLTFSSVNYASYTLSKMKIGVDPIITKKVVAYEKFYVFALQLISMSSIIYFINLMLKNLQKIKRKKLKLLDIISIYFPQVQDYRIKFNFLGQISSVTTLDGEIRNLRQWRQFYQKYSQSAKEKLKLKNIIYYISRLQYICMSLQDRDAMMNAHTLGIKLNLQQEIQNETTTIELNEIDDPIVLRGSDMDLLSQPTGPIFLGESKIGFYKRNRGQNMNKKFQLI
ncbi:unnamed protein product (macronuclear) [Paramecium tetraurelia]|uniref:Transmembrane protein n=1 Tax=Paramecium tetraurelia TaxID=5888 RepID=A0C914_PARTE|nr:uncharacterized protein GSPATT00006587001 [Paramecium tetraurelia]CAK67281.1 unnamed protein product [Paramecium tetraurelia]|eukprot:XP_001434678.1 hypothetical protein (macronuclear) [Paramecium tetraurelia strain d4-2]